MSDLIVKNPVIEEISKIDFNESEYESLKELVGNIKSELTTQKDQMRQIEQQKSDYDSKGSFKRFFSGGQLKKTMQEAVFLQNRSAQTQIDMLFLLMLLSKELHNGQNVLIEQQKSLTKNTTDIHVQQKELNIAKKNHNDLQEIFVKISDRFKKIEERISDKTTGSENVAVDNKVKKGIGLGTVLFLMVLQTAGIIIYLLKFYKGN